VVVGIDEPGQPDEPAAVHVVRAGSIGWRSTRPDLCDDTVLDDDEGVG
jgi:hypothetical protein